MVVPNSQIQAYLTFKSAEIKDLYVHETPQEEVPEALPTPPPVVKSAPRPPRVQQVPDAVQSFRRFLCDMSLVIL